MEENVINNLSENEREEQEVVSQSEESAEELPYLTGKTILLVEDNEEYTQLCERTSARSLSGTRGRKRRRSLQVCIEKNFPI